jgi:hypothetical protein
VTGPGASPDRCALDAQRIPGAARSHPTAVQFSSTVRLTKREAFDACQALANADRFLIRAGRTAEAGALGDLFELFEERLSARER